VCLSRRPGLCRCLLVVRGGAACTLIPDSGFGADAGLGVDIVAMWARLGETTSSGCAERRRTMPYLSGVPKSGCGSW
jgi:hypothetical protein